MITVAHDADVTQRHPEHSTLVLRVWRAGALAVDDAALARLKERFRATGGDRKARAAAVYWRGVYDELGAKPKYQPSVGALLQMYDRTGDLAIPIALVQMYCWFSLVHGVPMAGYRPERVKGGLRLAIPGPGMPFTPLNRAVGSLERTKPREIAYVDDEKTICRYWNYRDCDQTKLVDGVGDVLFIFDLAPSANADHVDDPQQLVDGLVSCLSGGLPTAFGVIGGTANPWSVTV